MLGNLASCTTVTMATCILKDVERVFKHKVRKAVFTEMFAWDLMSNFTRALVFSFIEIWYNARSFPVGEKIGQPRAATNLYTTTLLSKWELPFHQDSVSTCLPLLNIPQRKKMGDSFWKLLDFWCYLFHMSFKSSIGLSYILEHIKKDPRSPEQCVTISLKC